MTRHPYILPNVETVEDMFLELKDDMKFNILKYTNKRSLKSYDVKTCECELDSDISSFIDFDSTTIKYCKTITKTFRINQIDTRIKILAGDYWSDKNYLNSKQDKDLLDVIERIKHYLGEDLISISGIIESKYSSDLKSICDVDFISYEYEIIKVD